MGIRAAVILEQSGARPAWGAGTAHPKWGDVEEEKRNTAANRMLMAAYLGRP